MQTNRIEMTTLPYDGVIQEWYGYEAVVMEKPDALQVIEDSIIAFEKRTSQSKSPKNPRRGKGKRSNHRKSASAAGIAMPKLAPTHAAIQQQDVQSKGIWSPHARRKMDSRERFQKEVNAFLNKLSAKNFAVLSQEFTQLVTSFDSKQSSPRHYAELAISYVFEKAVSEPAFSELYAQLALVLLHEYTTEEKHADGSALYTHPLRNRMVDKCQNFFESYMIQLNGEATLLSNSNHTISKRDERIQTLRRMTMGNIKFIGELYMLTILSDTVVVRGILQPLLYPAANDGVPREEVLEALCVLLKTIGEYVDANDQLRKDIDRHFARLQELVVNESLSTRIRFMIRDVVDLRNTNWNDPKSPLTSASPTFRSAAVLANRSPVAHSPKRKMMEDKLSQSAWRTDSVEVKDLPAMLTPSQEKEIQLILLEYLDIEDKEEVLLCMGELKIPPSLHPKMLSCMVSTALEKAPPKRISLFHLIVHLAQQNTFEEDSIGKGMQLVIEELPSLCLDISPHSSEWVGDLLALFIEASLLPASLAKSFQALTDPSPALQPYLGKLLEKLP